MGLDAYLLLSAGLFSLGVFGLVTRKNLVGVLASVELMANAVNLNFVAFSRFMGGTWARCSRCSRSPSPWPRSWWASR